jgi:hypothetical protein
MAVDSPLVLRKGVGGRPSRRIGPRDASKGERKPFDPTLPRVPTAHPMRERPAVNLHATPKVLALATMPLASQGSERERDDRGQGDPYADAEREKDRALKAAREDRECRRSEDQYREKT